MATRKHFREFARAMRAISDLEERRRAAETIAAVCAKLNPDFDRVKFFDACVLPAWMERHPCQHFQETHAEKLQRVDAQIRKEHAADAALQFLRTGGAE